MSDADRFEAVLATVPDSSDRLSLRRVLELSLWNAIVTKRAHGISLRRSVDAMQTALAHCDRALDEHAAVGHHHGDLGEAVDRLHDHRRSAGTALRAFRRALEAGDSEQAQECYGRCRRSIDGMGRELRAIGDLGGAPRPLRRRSNGGRGGRGDRFSFGAAGT